MPRQYTTAEVFSELLRLPKGAVFESQSTRGDQPTFRAIVEGGGVVLRSFRFGSWGTNRHHTFPFRTNWTRVSKRKQLGSRVISFGDLRWHFIKFLFDKEPESGKKYRITLEEIEG